MSSPIFEDPQPSRGYRRRRRRSLYRRTLDYIVGSRRFHVMVGVVLALVALLYLVIRNPFYDPDTAGQTQIECRMPGEAGFEKLCTVEAAARPSGTVLTVRSPDGEFHRLLVVSDGRGVIAADGAQEVVVKPAGPGWIDVTAGDIVWRLPAKVKA